MPRKKEIENCKIVSISVEGEEWITFTNKIMDDYSGKETASSIIRKYIHDFITLGENEALKEMEVNKYLKLLVGKPKGRGKDKFTKRRRVRYD